MRKFLIFCGVGVLVIIILGGVVLFFVRKQTKSFSPEETVSYSKKDLLIEVSYNRPFKKGRKIFGGLVPYNQVWRTGANESSTFETNKDLKLDGKILKAGKYSLWTIPGEESWTVFFNSEFGQWGINFNGDANRNPAYDVLSVTVNSMTQERLIQQFTIAFEDTGDDSEMVFLWDKTLVAVPFSY